jgi:hypothetical protein
LKGLSPEQQRDLILSLGVHKGERQLSPVEVAELFRKTIGAGTTAKELATEVMLNITMIPRFLRLLNLDPEVQHLIGWGGKNEMSFSTAAEIARAKSAADQDYLTRAALENRLSKTEIIGIIEAQRKFGRPVSDCVVEILGMRPQITKRYLYIGGVTSAATRARLAAMTQKDRDSLFEGVIRSVQPELSGCYGRLGKGRFSIIGGEELDSVLRGLRSGFESVVNHYLESAMGQRNG